MVFNVLSDGEIWRIRFDSRVLRHAKHSRVFEAADAAMVTGDGALGGAGANVDAAVAPTPDHIGADFARAFRVVQFGVDRE